MKYIIRKRFLSLSNQLLLILGFICFFSLAHADQQSFANELKKILNAAIENSACTPGAVLLVSDPTLGTTVVAAGVSDIVTEHPMTPNNNFRLASISKTFLAVVLLKLSENGEINLDDKIANLLPNTIDAKRIPNGELVTVRQLLQMRSGIPNYLDYDAYTNMVNSQQNPKWIPKDGISMIYDEMANFEPGESYEYSNTNYIILQSIIEKLTGTSLAAQFKKYIFNPLHMQHTYQEAQEERPNGFYGLITHGYEMENNKIKDVTTLNDGFGLGDGGIISTAHDLAIFVQALLQTKTLLTQKELEQMLDLQGSDKYGLGIYQEQIGDKYAFTHNGSSSGFAGQFYYFPDRKLTIIILTNCYDTDIIEDVATETLNLVKQQSALNTAKVNTKTSLNSKKNPILSP